MRKEGWHAWTLFLAAALVLTNAAWFYSGRVEAVAASQRAPRPAACPEPEIVYQAAPTTPQGVPAPLLDNQRCINGQRFERITNGWRSVPEDC